MQAALIIKGLLIFDLKKCYEIKVKLLIKRDIQFIHK